MRKFNGLPFALALLALLGHTHLMEGPTCSRAFRLIEESGDGYLVELEVAAAAWALAASSGTTPSCCIRPRASQLT